MPELQGKGKYRILRVGNLSGGNDSWYYSDMELDDNKYCQKGDLLYAWACTFGPHIWKEERVIYHYHVWKLVENKEKVDRLYLYYYLLHQTPFYLGGVNGATMVHITKQSMEKKIVFIPSSIKIQQKIASILSTYDTLIENNTKRIRLLEQMAENLYKEWFVRFRFPGHENVEMENGLPKGWKKVSAEERYDITIGKTPPRKESQWFTADNTNAINWVSISDMKDTFISNTKEQLTKEAIDKFNMVVLPKHTIILSFKLTVGRVAIVDEASCTNEAIAHFKSVSKEEYEYLYLYLKHFEYGNLGNTSAIGNAINSKIVKKMDIVIPEQYILGKFHNIAKRMIERINSLQHQSTLLTRQCDLLLPRLMSGKLEVQP